MLRLVPRASLRTPALLLCALAAGACSDSPLEPASPDAPLLAKGADSRKANRVVVVAPEELAQAHDTLTVGTSATLILHAYDARGREMASPTVAWSVDASYAAITSGGTVTTSGPGPVTVTAKVNGNTGTYSFTSVAAGTASPTTPPVVPPATDAPTTASSIAAVIQRFDGGSGQTVVSSGVPLAPGALRPGQEGAVRVTVGGVEQPTYVAGLKSLHADGSLRAVLIQLRATVASGQPLQARVEIGAPRTIANTIGAPITAPASVPGTALLPTDPAYLIGTQLVGATRTSAEVRALGGAFATYESDFVKFADQHWAIQGDHWEGNYYDRALIYYAMWARTGNGEYWWRAARQAYTYRRDYVEPANYGVAPHWAMMEGLEKHYLLTGDEKSRVAVVRSQEAVVGYLPEYYTPAGGDVRIMARFIQGAMLAWRLTPNGDTPAGAQPRDWAARLEFLLQKSREWQQADGSYPAAVVCNSEMNYQAGLLNDALIGVHTFYRADPSIVTQVKRNVDYLWKTQWVASAQAFNYLSLSCPGVGGPEPAGDLTGLMLNGFGWVYRQTGDVTYRTNGDQVFAGAVAGDYLQGDKQFNQMYGTSWRYFGFR